MKKDYEEYCPHCKADLVGDPIPENIRHHYAKPYYWLRKIGIYSRELDRTVAWQCPDCLKQWDRK